MWTVLLACRVPDWMDTGKLYRPDTAADPASADDLLARLRADRDAALLEQARAGGWPAPTDQGWLFVCPDCAWPQVAGDFDGWAGTRLTEEPGLSWVIVEDVPPDSGYKLTDGSSYAADAWARSLVYDANGELSLIAPTRARLDRIPGFSGGGLEARAIRVWVPEGEIERTIFVHDGQNLFDPEAIWGGWRLQESLPSGVMAVGIDNTYARMDEYTHVEDDIGEIVGGQAAAYAEVVAEARAFVADRYGEPGPVGVMGSSLGGLVSLYLARHDPDAWAFAASLSGTVGWGSIGLNNPTIIELMRESGHQSVPIYLDSGGSGSCSDRDGDGIEDDDANASDNYCENLQLRDTLEAAGYTFDVDLWHWWEPDAPHNEAAWADRVWRPLEIFVGVEG